MYKLQVEAGSMEQLKERLQQAADGINTDVVGNFPTNQSLGYPDQSAAAPAPTPVNTAPRFPLPGDHAAAAPVAQAQAPVSATGHQVDNRGFPWDARIHSSNKSITAKGVWQKKKNVDENFVRQVEQELVGRIKSGEINNDVPATQPSSVIPFPGAAPAPVAPVAAAPSPFPAAAPAPVSPLTVPNHEQPAPAPVAAAVMPQPIPAAAPGTPAHSFESFQKNMIPVLASLTSSGKLTQGHIDAMKNHMGVKELWAVTADQARDMFESFVEWGWITKVGQ
ncbi:MAG: hypothetical protein ACRCV5_03985 [Afipia sp.]